MIKQRFYIELEPIPVEVYLLPYKSQDIFQVVQVLRPLFLGNGGIQSEVESAFPILVLVDIWKKLEHKNQVVPTQAVACMDSFAIQQYHITGCQAMGLVVRRETQCSVQDKEYLDIRMPVMA